MKITAVKLLVLEDSSRKGSVGHSIAPPDGPGWGAEWDEDNPR